MVTRKSCCVYFMNIIYSPLHDIWLNYLCKHWYLIAICIVLPCFEQTSKSDVKEEERFWHNLARIWTQVLEVFDQPRYQLRHGDDRTSYASPKVVPFSCIRSDHTLFSNQFSNTKVQYLHYDNVLVLAKQMPGIWWPIYFTKANNGRWTH